MSSLRSAIQQAVGAAFKAIGDIAVSANYHSHTTTSYNASSGVQTATFTTIAGVLVVFDVFRAYEIDNVGVRPDDRKALMVAASLGAVVPSLEDKLVVDGSTAWEVVRIEQDPANAHYSLQVRRP